MLLLPLLSPSFSFDQRFWQLYLKTSQILYNFCGSNVRQIMIDIILTNSSFSLPVIIWPPFQYIHYLLSQRNVCTHTKKCIMKAILLKHLPVIYRVKLNNTLSCEILNALNLHKCSFNRWILLRRKERKIIFIYNAN